ncbi:MAG: hypothetical protein ACOC0V_03985 [Oceanicaulis sp.]
MRTLYAAVSGLALIGAILAAFAYFAPDTGVDGTIGALLALIGAVCVTIGAGLAALPKVHGPVLAILTVLIGLGAVLTAIAAWFLMRYGFAAVMALAFAVLIAAAVASNRDRGRDTAHTPQRRSA